MPKGKNKSKMKSSTSKQKKRTVKVHNRIQPGSSLESKAMGIVGAPSAFAAPMTPSIVFDRAPPCPDSDGQSGLRITARFRPYKIGSFATPTGFLGIMADRNNTKTTGEALTLGYSNNTSVAAFFPIYLQSIAEIFTRFRMRSLVCDYRPFTGTSTGYPAGVSLMAVAWCSDPIVVTRSSGAVPSVEEVMMLPGAMQITPWLPSRSVFHEVKDNDQELLYTRILQADAKISEPLAVQVQSRQVSPGGIIGIADSSNSGAGDQYFGNLWLTVVFDLYNVNSVTIAALTSAARSRAPDVKDSKDTKTESLSSRPEVVSSEETGYVAVDQSPLPVKATVRPLTTKR